MKKILSILIPNYNHAKYLPECLSSVIQNTSEDVEILVMDDASTDHSVEVIESFLKKDKRIKLVKNKTNKGVNKTLNEGLRLISGEYVFGLAADDRLLPYFFPEILPILKNHPEIDLCSSDYAYFYNDKPDEIRINRLLKTSDPYLILQPSETLKYFRKTEFWIPGHASVMRTAWALKYGGYREEIRHYSDFFLFHKIALTRVIGYVPKGLSAMRIVSGSYSSAALTNREIRSESQRSLLNLISTDETQNLFAKSTLLRSIIKDNLFKAIFSPNYWKFLFPLIKKKIRKLLLKLEWF